MATEKKNTRTDSDDDFKVLRVNKEDHDFVDVLIRARNSNGDVVGSGEFTVPTTDAPIAKWVKYYGSEEELKLNAFRNKLVSIRSSLKTQGKKAGRGGLASMLRRKSA